MQGNTYVHGKFINSLQGRHAQNDRIYTKGSVYDSLGRRKGGVNFGIGKGKKNSYAQCSKPNKLGVIKQETIALSSNGSCNGEKLPHDVEGANKWSKNKVSKTQHAYIEEIEGG